MAGERPTALVLVRNDVTTDARVRREVDALRHAGLEPLVVGVLTDRAPEAEGTVAGAPLRRLPARAPRLPRRRRVSPPPAVPAPPSPAAPPPAVTTLRVGPLRRAARLLGALVFYSGALGVVRRTRPVLLHCNDHNTMWVGVAARVLWRTPVVYDAHELWPDRTGRWELRPVLVAAEWLFVRVAGAVVTASPGYADAMARRYRTARPTVVLNAPEAAPVGEPGAPANPPTLVYAGGLLAGRGLEDAIRALTRLPGWRLRIMGPGAESARQALQALAERDGVADRVELLPPVAPEDVVAALRGASAGLVLIQPVSLSYELTMPNKLFEYIAAGLPVIATDIPVLAATVAEHDIGEVVPPGDPAAVAAAAQRIAGRPELGARVRAAAGVFTWERERERLLAAYAAARGCSAPAGADRRGSGPSH